MGTGVKWFERVTLHRRIRYFKGEVGRMGRGYGVVRGGGGRADSGCVKQVVHSRSLRFHRREGEGCVGDDASLNK